MNPMRGRVGVALSLWRRGIYDPFVLLNALELRRLLIGLPAVLDVGCGNASPLQDLQPAEAVGLDGYAPSLEAAKAAHTHSRFVLGDIRHLPEHFKTGEFDACIALDVIEHLPKEDGLKLIRDMESVARGRIIFLTPNGFLPQKHQTLDDLQEHLSGWSAEEMRGLGFTVIGLLGPKSLRGEFHRLKRSPRIFWVLVALVRHFTRTRSHPDEAAAILCYRDVDPGRPPRA